MSEFSRVSVSHTGARLRAGMVPTFIFPNQDGFLPNGGEAASQIEAQRKRVRFGEEEQGSGRSFRR